MKGFWEKFKSIGVLKRDQQDDMAAECARFRADQAYQQYMDEARFNLMMQLWSLHPDQYDEFQNLKRCQQALDGFDDFIDSAILSERMKQR